MASLNPLIADTLSRLVLPRHAVVIGPSGVADGREVLLAKRVGMHLDVSKNVQNTVFSPPFRTLVSRTTVLDS